MKPTWIRDDSWLKGVGIVILAILGIAFYWWYYATCTEWGPERQYIESCGKDCIHTVYRRECIKRD